MDTVRDRVIKKLGNGWHIIFSYTATPARPFIVKGDNEKPLSNKIFWSLVKDRVIEITKDQSHQDTYNLKQIK